MEYLHDDMLIYYSDAESAIPSLDVPMFIYLAS